MNPTAENTTRPLTEREAKKARQAYIEAQNAIDKTSAGRLYTALEFALLPHVPHAIKQIQVALISCANYSLMRRILLDCEFGKLPTAEEIHTMACKIYNELLTPPTWSYGQELSEFLDTQFLHQRERVLLERTFPRMGSYVNYRAAREQIAPDEFISINEKTEAILQEQSKRTGRTRTDIMNRLLEIAAAAGLAEQIPPATEAPAKQTL